MAKTRQWLVNILQTIGSIHQKSDKLPKKQVIFLCVLTKYTLRINQISLNKPT